MMNSPSTTDRIVALAERALDQTEARYKAEISAEGWRHWGDRLQRDVEQWAETAHSEDKISDEMRDELVELVRER